MGSACADGATVAYLLGFPLVGAALGLAVTSLALLAAVAGFCTGCWMYKIAAPFFGIHIRHIDPASFCADCAVDSRDSEAGC